MKKLVIFSLFALIVFSCKKKEEEVDPKGNLTVNINDSGSVIYADKFYNVYLYKNKQDLLDGNKADYSDQTKGTTSVEFKNIDIATYYIFAMNALYTDSTITINQVNVTGNASITVELPY